MQQLTLLTPRTAEFGPFGLQTIVFDAKDYEWVIVAADALGVGEAVTIAVAVSVGNPAAVGVEQATDEGGVALTLTPSIPSRRLRGGVQYQFNKSATAAACGLYVQLGPRKSRR